MPQTMTDRPSTVHLGIEAKTEKPSNIMFLIPYMRTTLDVSSALDGQQLC